MSEFDKEAEREKLREKYERDERDRESTRQMSELLLQGATMTNRHCDECGDPIFRYDGQEFCANCQQAEGENQAAEDAEQQAESAQEGSDRAQTPRQSGGDPRQEPTPGETDARPAGHQDGAGDQYGGETGRVRDDVEDQSARDRPVQNRASRGQSSGRDARPSGPREGEAALWNALTKFARKAEATDDPREAGEHLAAAREAAEALSALRR